jgi:hypothetical protein
VYQQSLFNQGYACSYSWLRSGLAVLFAQPGVFTVDGRVAAGSRRGDAKRADAGSSGVSLPANG